MSRLAIVTASTDFERARPCLQSWIDHAVTPPPVFVILQSGARPETLELTGAPVAWIHREDYLGSVKAFRLGVDAALSISAYDVIACLHDDFQIYEGGWDEKVLKYFDRRAEIGLVGFGGATGLGALDMYQRAYDPMSLARVGFRSDLEDAEAHGLRSVLAERVACLDGFSQIGCRSFWEGTGRTLATAEYKAGITHHYMSGEPGLDKRFRPWQILEDLGIVHHLYDGLLGAIAARHGWETWYLPLRARHWGGRTAVGDPGYQAWAKARGGDQGFWEAAHRIGYEAFRDVLPLRV